MYQQLSEIFNQFARNPEITITLLIWYLITIWFIWHVINRLCLMAERFFGKAEPEKSVEYAPIEDLDET